MLLYTLKYKKPLGMGTTLIGPCPSHPAAEALGRHWCSSQSGPGYRYVNVECAVSATMADLPAADYDRFLGPIKTAAEERRAKLTDKPVTVTPRPEPKHTPASELAAVATAAGADRSSAEPEPISSPISAAAPARRAGRVGQ